MGLSKFIPLKLNKNRPFSLLDAQAHVILTSFDVAEVVTKLIPTSSLVLFCATGLLISHLFRRLRQQTYLTDFHEGIIPNIQHLRRMQRQHDLLTRCVTRLSKTFGPCLLLEVSFIFIAVINNSFTLFFIVSSSASEDASQILFLHVLVAFSFLSNHIVKLALMVHVADKIHEEV